MKSPQCSVRFKTLNAILLDCKDPQFGESSTLRRDIPPPSSGSKSRPNGQKRVGLCKESTRVNSNRLIKFKLHCDRRSVGQFVLVSGPIRGRCPDFKLIWVTITYFLLHVGRPLWREDRSVICSAIKHSLEYRRTRNNILLSHLRLL
jgi:hypothetical protein